MGICRSLDTQQGVCRPRLSRIHQRNDECVAQTGTHVRIWRKCLGDGKATSSSHPYEYPNTHEYPKSYEYARPYHYTKTHRDAFRVVCQFGRSERYRQGFH